MELRGALEDNILTLLCWDETHAPGLALRLTPEIFSTRAYRKIADIACDHIGQYSLPPRSHLIDLLEDDLRKSAEGSLLRDTLARMEDLARDIQPDFVLTKLDEYITTRKLAQALEASADALSRGDLAAAREALYASNVTPDPNKPGIWLHDSKAMLAVLETPERNFFSSGVEVLDARGCRPERKAVDVLIAAAKRGKSWSLIEKGKANVMLGHNVLHITLENSEEITAKRYMQSMFALTLRQITTHRLARLVKDELGRCTSIDFDEIQPDSLESIKKTVLARRIKGLKNRGKLLIKEFPTGELTIGHLNAYLDALEREHSFIPDLVLIDYPNLMALPTKDFRISLGMIFRQIRGIAVKRNIAISTVTQGNRISAQAKTVTSGHVGEDFSMIGTADLVITYSQTGEERKIGLARLLVSEARSAEDKFVTLITQSYPTGQFCIDSCYMSKLAESELDRLTGGSDEDDE